MINITAEQYKKALQEIKITDKQMLMLQAHYEALNKSITFQELSKVAGYDNYSIANMQYGGLGHLIGDAVNFEFQKSQIKKEDTFFSSAIGFPNPYITDNFNLVMYHELAKAIEQLDLFNMKKD
jgi:hypothetical protein